MSFGRDCGDLWSALAEILRHESKAPIARGDLWKSLDCASLRARAHAGPTAVHEHNISHNVLFAFSEFMALFEC